MNAKNDSVITGGSGCGHGFGFLHCPCREQQLFRCKDNGHHDTANQERAANLSYFVSVGRHITYRICYMCNSDIVRKEDWRKRVRRVVRIVQFLHEDVVWPQRQPCDENNAIGSPTLLMSCDDARNITCLSKNGTAIAYLTRRIRCDVRGCFLIQATIKYRMNLKSPKTEIWFSVLRRNEPRVLPWAPLGGRVHLGCGSKRSDKTLNIQRQGSRCPDPKNWFELPSSASCHCMYDAE